MGEGKSSDKDEVHLRYNLRPGPGQYAGLTFLEAGGPGFCTWCQGKDVPAWEGRTEWAPAASATGGSSEPLSQVGYSGRGGKRELSGLGKSWKKGLERHGAI